MNRIILFFFLLGFLIIESEAQNSSPDMTIPNGVKTEQATLGAGCFWCVEAVFQDLKGVYLVESGYMGGHEDNPSYQDVCAGTTGHAEVGRITFDPDIISYKTLLEVFWTTHDPTTVNRQGNDIGPQYRSVIFYYNDVQRKVAEKSKVSMGRKIWDEPIVTEITAATEFFVAEDYHQNYFTDNPNAGYCRAIINPKVKKARKKFSHLLKDDLK
jgi:peptide-methionine (S)-S-oxide reductase